MPLCDGRIEKLIQNLTKHLVLSPFFSLCVYLNHNRTFPSSIGLGLAVGETSSVNSIGHVVCPHLVCCLAIRLIYL